ncbi:hypothetical protein E2605_18105 [Dysgonomonas capnocytophagoides]|uniref:Uncharacterized protein n=1 Tax=Dysgonomonas capnocytophagoides TaxID=45254 RepID=A0A4Y8KV30_9BACT|nr:hypothetical protein [Dysgonomonas capnocytophagoides]TFD92758.1 hypothetical protein E2605_18105 [Dysgonomonas capnocytophagoides]
MEGKKKGGCLKAVLIGIGVLFVLFLISKFSSNDKEDIKPQVDSRHETIEDDKAKSDSISKARLAYIDIELGKMKPLFNYRYDEFEKTTWIEHKSIPKYVNTKGFYTYIGMKDNSVWERLVIRYHGEDWLFIQKIMIKADESIFEITPQKVERDNDSQVWEYIDITPDKTEIAMISNVIASKTTKIRFEGKQHYFDWVLSSKEINALKDTQIYFNLLSEKEELENR